MLALHLLPLFAHLLVWLPRSQTYFLLPLDSQLHYARCAGCALAAPPGGGHVRALPQGLDWLSWCGTRLLAAAAGREQWGAHQQPCGVGCTTLCLYLLQAPPTAETFSITESEPAPTYSRGVNGSWVAV